MAYKLDGEVSTSTEMIEGCSTSEVASRPVSRHNESHHGSSVHCWSVCCSKNPSITTSHLWNYADIEYEEVNQYKEMLLTYQQSKAILTDEFLTCCRLNCVKRLEVVYNILIMHHNFNIVDIVLAEEMFESPLMLSIISGSVDTALFAVRKGGKELVSKQFKGKLYRGATALHMAILNNMFHVVQTMLNMFTDQEEMKSYLTTLAGGELFKLNKLSGLPPLLALQCGQLDIYFHLVDNGVDMDLVDPENGNTAIHVLIEVGQRDPTHARKWLEQLFDHSTTIKWYCRKFKIQPLKYMIQNKYEMMTHFLQIENKDGFTPLTFAAKLCVCPVLKYMFDCEGVYKHTKYKLGPFSYLTYNLEEIDPAVARLVQPGKPTVLELLLSCGDEAAVPMLSVQPIRELIKNKWRCYRVPFCIWALCHIIFMLLETYVIVRVFAYFTKTEHFGSNSTQTIRLWNITQEMPQEKLQSFLSFNSIMDVIVSVIGLIYCFVQVIEVSIMFKGICMNRLFRAYTGYYKAPWSVIFSITEYDIMLFGFWVSTTLWSYIYWTSHSSHEYKVTSDLLMCGSLINGWLYTLYFTRIYEAISYFAVMMHHIVRSDLLSFGFIITVIMIGFGTSLFLLFNAGKQPPPTQMATMPDVLNTLFLLMIGNGELDFIDGVTDGYYKAITLLTYLYLITCTILMLNILIAAVTDTYSAVTEQRINLFYRLRLQSVVRTENCILSCIIRYCILQKYATFDQERQKWIIAVTAAHTVDQG